jgi:hypothetical protein
MQLVINIDEVIYKRILPYKDVPVISSLANDFPEIIHAVANGVPLPKGHGRIGDLDKLIRDMKERNDDNGGEPLNAVDRGYDLAYQHIIKEAKECVFIEADRSEEHG